MADLSIGNLTRQSERVTTWLARAGSVGLAAMMFLTLFDVIGRSFDNPIVGSVELTELIMGLMIYLAIGYATFWRSHIRVDLLIGFMPPRVQALMDTLTYAIAIVFSVLLTWRLFVVATEKMTSGDITQIFEIPVSPAAYVMALASILLITTLVLQFILSIRHVFTGEPPEIQKTGGYE